MPNEVWYKNIRPAVLKRDHYKCTNCLKIVSLTNSHIDHIVSGKCGNNKLSNLRTLCIPCHSLRQCNRHRGLTANAIRDGLIPPDWRQLTWED
ncbi:HNH endonuclease [Robertmurraya sp. 2P01SA]